jgi:RND superfamily putative drug exporter
MPWFGAGLSIGVALAAMTVLLLAPALLVLAGAGSWWLPAWLDRSLPHGDIEGASLRSVSAGGVDSVASAAPAEP